MFEFFPPALIFILGSLLIPFLKGRVRDVYVLALPVIGLLNLLSIPLGTHGVVQFLDFELVLGQVDRLSFIFGLIFHIISFITIVYILNFKNNVEYMAGFFYAGSALGAIFSGDLLSFFIFWEALTVGSMFLILARKTQASVQSAYRYALVHVVGGLFLLMGILMHIQNTGSMTFEYIGLQTLAGWLIFLGFGINCAWPVLHTWLVDGYPEATIGGTVFLSAITTKTAVYALARAFPGAEPLIWIGTAMALFPIFYAVVENDLRRVLAYSLINQVGFMVVGIGLGDPLGINGAIAHAFNDVFFKGLLFMSVGAVMYRTGKVKATDLGGLYKCMPWTCFFCLVGAASISAFPLFSGFVSKSMVQSSAAHQGQYFVWFALLFAAAGVFHHAGIKIPFFTFFSHDAGHKVKEAPLNMLIAMGLAAFLCIFNGTFPQYLYSLLPFPVDYVPYTASHILAQSQLLAFSAFAFCLLLLSGIYPSEIRAINLDTDWFYRKGGRLFNRATATIFNGLNRTAEAFFIKGLVGKLAVAAQNAPARLSLALFVPIWVVNGLTKKEMGERKKALYLAFEDGALPIGFSCAVVLVLLGGFFLI